MGPLLGDGAHDDAALKRNGVAADAEALTVLVGPGGTDGGPAGGVAVADDTIEAMGRFVAGRLGGLLGHGGLLPVRPRTIPRLHGEPGQRAIELAVTPRASARPEGAELHEAEGEGSELG